MTWTVSIDVPVLRGVVSDLNDFVTLAREERSDVTSAAVRACTGAPSLAGLNEHIDVVSDAAADMEARIELAILVNSDGGELSLDSPLTYEIPAYSADTGDLARRMLGEELANLGNEIVEDGAEDWQVELLAEQLEQWGENDDVMTSMFESLGPDGTIYLTSEMGAYSLDGGDFETAQRVVDELRDGLENASEAWDDTYAEQFGREMVDAAVSPDFDTYDGNGTSVALSLLMYDSNYSGEFITGVADRIDEVEREGEVQSGFWSGLASMPNGMGAFFPEDAREAAFDPIVSVFGSMADQPDVALDWWNDSDRQEYWIKDRTWAHDDFQSVAAVLDSASTHPSHIDPPTDQNGDLRPEAVAAADLASAAINYLPQNADFGSQKSGAWIFSSHHWGGEAAGESLAHIVSTYMPSVADTLSQDRTQDLPGSGSAIDPLDNTIELMPYFEKDALAEIIQVASRSDEGFAELRSGVSAHNNQLLAMSVTDSTPGDSLSHVSNAIATTAEIEGFFAYNVGGGNISEAQARDERNQAWVDLGSDLLGAVPVPGGQVVGFVADQAISVTADQVSEAVTGNEGVEIESANRLAEESLYDYKAQTLWALQEAGGLPHQQEGAASLAEIPGVHNGDLITAEYIEAQPEDDQAALLDEVVDFANSGSGLGAYAIEQDISGWYKDPFIEYFEGG